MGIKLTIGQVRKRGKEKGFTLLSTEYGRNNIRLDWTCLNGHIFSACYSNIQQGKGCVYCSHIAPVTFEMVIEKANELGWKVLSKSYRNNISKMRFICSKGHEFLQDWSGMKRGRGCSQCSRNKKRTIADMREFANSKNWRCLSKKYFGNHHKLKWECEKGHRYELEPNSLFRGISDCPKCGKRNRIQHDIEEMQKIAASYGGKCLSKEYMNSNIKLEFECRLGHKFNKRPGNIIHQKVWCPECKAQLNFNDLLSLATAMKGRCLSDSTEKITGLIKWQCEKGHNFEAKFKDASKHWCSECISIINKLAA